jgi:hypothetical protein
MSAYPPPESPPVPKSLTADEYVSKLKTLAGDIRAARARIAEIQAEAARLGQEAARAHGIEPPAGVDPATRDALLADILRAAGGD